MVTVVCHTNLDKGSAASWPREMVCVPRVDDRVQADCGMVLRVATITHAMGLTSVDGRREPYVKVELHLPHGTTVRQWDGY